MKNCIIKMAKMLSRSAGNAGTDFYLVILIPLESSILYEII